MFDDIVLFIHIVQSQGLAAAAQKLNIPAATITRRLQKLERSLGCQLIHRSARKFVLTQEGEAYYHAYAELVDQLESTQRNLSSEMLEMSGKLKVLAPTNISIGMLQPMWSSFIKTYPDIQLEVSLNNSFEDLLPSQADIALRIGPQQDSILYQKRLGSLKTVMVASPEYLEEKGEPKTLEELPLHNLIGSQTVSVWHLSDDRSDVKKDVRPRFKTVSNDIKFISQLVCDGIGISLLPISEVQTHIQKGELRHVLPNWVGPNRDLFAVWPTGRLLNAKAKCLRDFMQSYIELNLKGLTTDALQTQNLL